MLQCALRKLWPIESVLSAMGRRQGDMCVRPNEQHTSVKNNSLLLTCRYLSHAFRTASTNKKGPHQ